MDVYKIKGTEKLSHHRTHSGGQRLLPRGGRRFYTMGDNQVGEGESVSPPPIEFSHPNSSSRYLEYPTNKPIINTNYSPRDRPVNTTPTTDRDAVINALRNLQEKIKSLEMERTMAEKNLHNLTSETEEYKRLGAGARHTAAGTGSDPRDQSGDCLLQQTRELEGQLSLAEGRCQLLETQLHEMRKLVESSQKSKLSLSSKTRTRPADSIGPSVGQHMDRLNKLERDQIHLTVTQSIAELKASTLTQKSHTHHHQHQPTVLAPPSAVVQKTHHIKVLKIKKSSKKKKRSALSSSTHTCHSNPARHYRLNLAEIPFVAGKSTGPSHALGANVQRVLAMMKQHNSALCSHMPAGEEGQRLESVSSSSNTSSSMGQDLNELLSQLQDEFGQLSSRQQEIVEQMHLARDARLRERLEQELDKLMGNIDSKSQQIATIRQHQHKIESAKKFRPSSVKQKDKLKKAHTSAPPSHSHPHSHINPHQQQSHSNGHVVHRGQPKSHVCNKPLGNSALGNPALFMLRDMKKIQSNLQKESVCWE